MCSRIGDPAPCLVPEPVSYVEDSGHASKSRRLVDIGYEGRDGGVNHTEVVNAAGAYHLVFEADSAGAFGVVEREVVVEDLIGIDVELFRYQGTDNAFRGRAVEGYHRQHVLLPRQRIAFVDSAVEVDGKMGDRKERTVYAHQFHPRAQKIVAAERYAACDRQRAVEPSI